MSYLMPRRAIGLDPLTEHLKNLDPTQVDALEMMRGVYSNQVALSAALIDIHSHVFSIDTNINDLADSTAANVLQHLRAMKTELEKEQL